MFWVQRRRACAQRSERPTASGRGGVPAQKVVSITAPLFLYLHDYAILSAHDGFVDLLQALIGEVEIDFRDIEAFMAEKLAHETNIDTVVNQIGRERMAESVRVNALELRH